MLWAVIVLQVPFNLSPMLVGCCSHQSLSEWIFINDRPLASQSWKLSKVSIYGLATMQLNPFWLDTYATKCMVIIRLAGKSWMIKDIILLRLLNIFGPTNSDISDVPRKTLAWTAWAGIQTITVTNRKSADLLHLPLQGGVNCLP